MIEMGHSSAMENFGLIVYTRFLSQLPIATPSPYKVSQTIIMCHEIAHQWFGGRVLTIYLFKSKLRFGYCRALGL